MSAAVIHLVNISAHPGTHMPDTERHLAEAIRIMHEMSQDITITGRYLPIIRDMIHRWCKYIPRLVQEAMDEVDIENAGTPRAPANTSNTPDATNSNQHPSTNGNTIFDPAIMARKPSAPEVLPMAPRLEPNAFINGSKALQQQNLFWTPYPESFEGIPLALPQDSNHLNHHMDITNVLDSGVSGDWPQWNRDGFTMGREDGNPQLWGLQWGAV